jgi:hypothetical protein
MIVFSVHIYLPGHGQMLFLIRGLLIFPKHPAAFLCHVKWLGQFSPSLHSSNGLVSWQEVVCMCGAFSSTFFAEALFQTPFPSE